MPYPTIDDDGVTVTLDLHGASVADAERLAGRAVAEARRRGRATVRLIHGSSTSGSGASTIRAVLRAAADAGRYGVAPGSSWQGDDVLVLALGHGTATDRRPITMLDLTR